MYKFHDDILIVDHTNEACFFDPENLFIFSKPKNVSNKEAIDNYKKHLKLLPEESRFKPLDVKDSSSVRLELHVTDNCNLRCKYCYLDGNIIKKNINMSEKTIEKAFDFVLQNFPKIKEINIGLIGGEPLLFWKKFDYLLKIAKQKFKGKKISFGFPTNGTMVNKEILSFMRQKGVKFSLSIDGDQKVQDYLRPNVEGGGSFQSIEKNLPLFQEINDSLMVRPTITPHNMKITELFENFKKQGFKQIAFVPCCSEEFQIDLQKYKKELEKFSEVYLKHLIEEKAIILVHPFSSVLKLLHRGYKKYKGCDNGKNLFAISIDEKFYSCHRFIGNQKFQIGDLNTGFYKNSPIRNKLVEFDVNSQKKCKKCFAKNLCAGGCTHEQSTETSREFCEIFRSVLSLSIKIYFKFISTPNAKEKFEKVFLEEQERY